jgi:hypothetical protein
LAKHHAKGFEIKCVIGMGKQHEHQNCGATSQASVFLEAK